MQKEFKIKHPEYDIKTLVLTILLRGGNPSANDRILASRLGVAAVDALAAGNYNVMVGVNNNTIITTHCIKTGKHFLTINQEWKHLLDLYPVDVKIPFRKNILLIFSIYIKKLLLFDSNNTPSK